MKRVIIVHMWGGTPDYCWYPQAKQQLKARGFNVEVPAMPEKDEPKLELWLPKLRQTVDEPDEDTFLVGHSIGCATILRYLEKLPEGQKIGGAVLVAGYTDNLDMPELANFYETPFNYDGIRKKAAKGFVTIHSDNDQYVDLKHSKKLQEELGGEAIVLHNKNHFSGPLDDEPMCTELPEVVAIIEKLTA